MRHTQARLVDHLPAVDEQIEVDRARSPALLAHAAEHPFDLEQEIEELPRRARRVHRDRPVQEGRLVDDADGLGLAKLRDGKHGDAVGLTEELHRSEKRPLALPEIGAEPDVRNRH